MDALGASPHVSILPPESNAKTMMSPTSGGDTLAAVSLNAGGNKEESVDKRLFFHTKMVILAGCRRMLQNRRDGVICSYICI